MWTCLYSWLKWRKEGRFSKRRGIFQNLKTYDHLQQHGLKSIPSPHSARAMGMRKKVKKMTYSMHKMNFECSINLPKMQNTTIYWLVPSSHIFKPYHLMYVWRMYLFNPSSRAGCDTRSVLKQSKACLNSEFFLLVKIPKAKYDGCNSSLSYVHDHEMKHKQIPLEFEPWSPMSFPTTYV